MANEAPEYRYDDSAFDDVAPAADRPQEQEEGLGTRPARDGFEGDDGRLTAEDEQEFEEFFAVAGTPAPRTDSTADYGSISDEDNADEDDPDTWAKAGSDSDEPDFDMGNDVDFNGVDDAEEGLFDDDRNSDGSLIGDFRQKVADTISDGAGDGSLRSMVAERISPDEGGERDASYTDEDFEDDFEFSDDSPDDGDAAADSANVPGSESFADDLPEDDDEASAGDRQEAGNEVEGGAEFPDDLPEDEPEDEAGLDGEPDEGVPTEDRSEVHTYTVYRADRGEDPGEGVEEPWQGDYDGGEKKAGASDDEPRQDDEGDYTPFHDELLREFEERIREGKTKIAGRTLQFDDDIDADEGDWDSAN